MIECNLEDHVRLSAFEHGLSLLTERLQSLLAVLCGDDHVVCRILALFTLFPSIDSLHSLSQLDASSSRIECLRRGDNIAADIPDKVSLFDTVG